MKLETLMTALTTIGFGRLLTLLAIGAGIAGIEALVYLYKQFRHPDDEIEYEVDPPGIAMTLVESERYADTPTKPFNEYELICSGCQARCSAETLFGSIKTVVPKTFSDDGDRLVTVVKWWCPKCSSGGLRLQDVLVSSCSLVVKQV
jgi:hypothetical protein